MDGLDTRFIDHDDSDSVQLSHESMTFTWRMLARSIVAMPDGVFNEYAARQFETNINTAFRQYVQGEESLTADDRRDVLWMTTQLVKMVYRMSHQD